MLTYNDFESRDEVPHYLLSAACAALALGLANEAALNLQFR